MLAGPLLAETRLAEFRPLGAMGEPVYLAHARLVAALERLGAADCARYFARPEPDARRESLSWYATLDGPVRPWDSLSEEERLAAEPKILAIRQRLVELRETPQSLGAREGLAFLLGQAAVSPGLEHLFLVGDQPVLTAWGFEAERTRFDTLLFAPTMIEPSTGTESASLASDRTWLMRWWWALIALALLLALIWVLLVWWSGREVLLAGSERSPQRSEPENAAPAARPSVREPVAEATPEDPLPPVVTPRSGERLAIPEKGIEFLEGTWKTESALVDRRDGKPIIQTFTFGRSGWGDVVTRRSDGVECRGRARARRTSGGGLVIYGIEQSVCSDGDVFVPFRLECAPGAGSVSDCRGVNADDGSSYDVVVRRL
ncbi:MAG TPA: hypothetical protein VED46_08835 [Alphaproteobacteria bacterium]|nr:hypothetical protein [Alphaproteobacteria bacterium]